MDCPACSKALTEIQVGSVKLDACEGGCGGIWFDAFEVQRVEKEHQSVGDSLVKVARDPALRVDFSLKRRCPRCDDIKLKRHFFSARKEVEVDQCPNCGGYWLDAGELEKVHAEKVHAAAEAHMADPGISMASIRFLYRQRLQERPQL
jgi:Zn-finger nucleic acid-binding protein